MTSAPGCVENGKIVIREILPEGVAEEAGLLEGDELVKIQGRAFEPTMEGTLKAQRFINAKTEGSILIYTVKRQGRQILLPLRLVKPLDLVQLALLLNGILAWAISLLVVVSAPERKSSRHFFYLASMTLLMSGATQSGNAPVAMTLTVFLMAGAAAALLPPLWIHFFLRFPHPFELRKNRRFLQAIYGIFALLAILVILRGAGEVMYFSTSKPLVGTPPDGTLRALRAFVQFLPIPFWVGSALTGLGFFAVGTFRSPERVRKALLPSLFVAALLCLDLLAWTILQTKYNSLLFRRQTFIFMLPAPLLPLSFAYAIFRHGLFEVRRALVRWVSYMAILALTVAGYLGGLAWGFSHLSSIPPGWAGALIGLLALPLGWTLRLLLKGIRRRFRRDFASTREIALSAVREPRKRFSEEALLKSLKKALDEAFRPQFLEVLPIEARRILLPAAETTDREDRRVHFPPQPLRLPPGLLRLARENRELVLGLGSEEADWIREQGEGLRAHVDALEAQLLLLILAGDHPHSAVLLGGKYAELNYGREDRELLREVALAAGQVLETAMMHQRLLAQERLSQELETARRIQEGLITSHLPPIPRLPGGPAPGTRPGNRRRPALRQAAPQRQLAGRRGRCLREGPRRGPLHGPGHGPAGTGRPAGGPEPGGHARLLGSHPSPIAGAAGFPDARPAGVG